MVVTNRGLSLINHGQHQQACDCLQQAVEQSLQLTNLERVELSHRVALATARNALGQARLGCGDARAAAEQFALAADAFEAAVKLDPLNPRHAESVATIAINLATAARRMGDLSAERDAYEKAIQIYDSLLVSQPDVPGYREGRAMARNDLGQLFLETGDLPAAIAELDAAQLELQHLATAYPLVIDYRNSYAVTLDNLADAHLRSNSASQAQEIATAALSVQQPLSAANPNVPTYRVQQATMLSHLAHAEALLAGDDTASARFEQAAQLLSLAAELPDASPVELHLLAVILTRHGEWLTWSGETEVAQAKLTRAAEIWARLANESDDPQFLDSAAWFFATCPDPELRDLELAKGLASRATEAAPQNVRFLLTRQLANRGATSELPAIDAEISPTWQARSAYIEALELQQTDEAVQRWQTAEELRQQHAPGDWELAALSQLVAGELKLDARPW